MVMKYNKCFLLGVVSCMFLAQSSSLMLARTPPSMVNRPLAIAGGVVVAGSAFKRFVIDGPSFDSKGVDLKGRTAVITGGNSGLGFETAAELASLGADVIIGVREPSSAASSSALAKLNRVSTNKVGVVALPLDLADNSSVREFAAQVMQLTGSRINILVNNAGVMAIPDRRLSAQGHEYQLAVNHIGHFFLTSLLLPALERSEDGRIITVSSISHEKTGPDGVGLEDLQLAKPDAYTGMASYRRSKLANVLFAKELQRRLEAKGANNVISIACHPGVANTNIAKYTFDKEKLGLIQKGMLNVLGKIVRSAKQGAQTTIFCAAADKSKLKGGAYYGSLKEEKPSPIADNHKMAAELWDATDALVAE